MTVVEMSDYRSSSGDGVFEVTFIAPRSTTPEGDQLNFTYTTLADDPDAAIAKVREAGGIFAEKEGEDTVWFMPWPCAAVRIKRIG